ncbi:MAG: UDP-glucose 4-epimerase GalE [Oscillospiraceae bacterium]|nr:UDP-glucose 4-epimerase GalE [Oscillospiraceae bacterium]
MAILVVGGAGYIGSHTVYALLEQDPNCTVIVADNLSTGHRRAVHPKAKFYELDIHNRAALDELFAQEQVEGVIHFAASSQVGESMEKPLEYYANNLGGTTTLLQAMAAADVRHIVFSSTAAVYGEPQNIPIREDDPTIPTNCYGETKLAVERMLAWAKGAHDLNYVALRYFNAAGAHISGEIGEVHNPETHLVPVVLQVPNGKRPGVSVFGEDYPTKDGTCVRDYIHVTDLADAHILALKYLRNGGTSDVFNLGNGVGFTVKEVIEVAKDVTAHEIPVTTAPRRAGDPAQLVASSEKARTVLGWKPCYDSLTTIVETAWQWHRTHPDGF